MFIVNNCPVNLEIWNFFYSQVLQSGSEENCSIVCFKDFFKEYAECPQSYLVLPFNHFFLFFEHLFKLASSLANRELRINVTDFDMFFKEVENILYLAKKWCILENLPAKSIKNHDPTEINLERGCLNPNIRYKMYFMCKQINNEKEKLKAFIKCKPNFALMERFEKENQISVKKICSLIRDKARGDLDEVILLTIDTIQSCSISDNHKHLAHLFRYTQFGEAKFHKSMSTSDCWRMLYPNFFQDYEDIFDKFFKRFTNECTLFFLNDYVQHNFGIERVPLLNIYYNNKGEISPYVCNLIDFNILHEKIYEIEQKYEDS